MAKLRDKVQDISLWLRTLLKVKGLYVVETCRYGPREAGTAQENRTRTRTPNRGALSLHEKQQKKSVCKSVRRQHCNLYAGLCSLLGADHARSPARFRDVPISFLWLATIGLVRRPHFLFPVLSSLSLSLSHSFCLCLFMCPALRLSVLVSLSLSLSIDLPLQVPPAAVRL